MSYEAKPTKVRESRPDEARIELGSGNVFADLGFRNAEDRLLKAKLAGYSQFQRLQLRRFFARSIRWHHAFPMLLSKLPSQYRHKRFVAFTRSSAPAAFHSQVVLAVF